MTRDTLIREIDRTLPRHPRNRPNIVGLMRRESTSKYYRTPPNGRDDPPTTAELSSALHTLHGDVK